MKRMPRLDIHNYELLFAQTQEQVRRTTISDRNKALILAYCDACLASNTCGRVRLIRIMGALTLFAQLVAKNFDALTREDVQRLVSQLLARQPPYTPETLGTYKAIFKRFMTWVVHPEDFPRVPAPPIVAWLTGHVRNKDKTRLDRAELLTPADIERVLQETPHPRDRALISVLWETGGRIAEIGNLQLKHVTSTEHGYVLDVDGKTGRRSPMIVGSAPALAAWMNQHPVRNDPEAPLWTRSFHGPPQLLRYGSIRNMLANHFKRAGITKRIYPHLFRHSRATYVLAGGLMTEAQAKKYFGWTPDSDQLATYSHLVDADANNAILRENKITPTAAPQEELRMQRCHQCNDANEPTAGYCRRCNAILDLKTAYAHQQVSTAKDQLFTSMFRLLVEKGLIDEAAKQVHDAGLGSTLKRLILDAKAAADAKTSLTTSRE